MVANFSLKNPVIIVLLSFLIFVFGCQSLYDSVGGNFSGKPKDIQKILSQKAKDLITASFQGIPDGQYVDHHIHVIAYRRSIGKLCPGNDISQYQAYINPKRFTWGNPILRVKTKVFMSACNVYNLDYGSEQYASRLLDLVKYFGKKGKFHILALDGYYETNGILNWEKTDILIPNGYILSLAKCLNQKIGENSFIPVISIHPYRTDAIERLKHFAKQGVRYVKWLPNAMNINPGRKENTEFYKTMVDLNMILLGHTGNEASLDIEESNQKLGNPLGYKLPLDLGVTVIMAHLGNWGENRDSQGKITKNYKIFFRMLEEAQTNGKWKLYGDLSAVTLENGVGNLRALFRKKHLWNRIVNGSDYPLPGVSFLNNCSKLQEIGFITEDEKEALDEIYALNPLLFDFVLKRTLRNPENRTDKLPSTMFMSLRPGKY